MELGGRGSSGWGADGGETVKVRMVININTMNDKLMITHTFRSRDFGEGLHMHVSFIIKMSWNVVILFWFVVIWIFSYIGCGSWFYFYIKIFLYIKIAPSILPE